MSLLELCLLLRAHLKNVVAVSILGGIICLAVVSVCSFVNPGYTATAKSPVFYTAAGFLGGLFCIASYYVLISILRGSIHTPETVIESGLTYLGMVDSDEAHLRIAVANLQFSGKDIGASGRTVLLVPSSNKVHIRYAYTQITQAAASRGLRIGVVPSLDSSVSALYKGCKADLVVVVVEAGVSTFDEVQQLIREFDIAGVKADGFVFLPYSASAKKAKKNKPSKKGKHQLSTS